MLLRYACAAREPEGGAEQPLECEQLSCLNEGVCVESYHGWMCQCLDGFEGPRCQNTKISFVSGAWGWFDTIG